MAVTPIFLIKKPAKTTGLCLIYLQMKWNGNRLLYSTGENVPLHLWNKQKQCVKNSSLTTRDGLHFLNDLLANMKSTALSAYRKETGSGGIPTILQISKYLDDFFYLNTEKENQQAAIPTLYQLIDKLINNAYLYKGRKRSIATIQTYKTTLKHLKEFERKEGYTINYQSITLEFFYAFINYLRKKGLQTNSLCKNIGVLKTFMGEAVDMGFTNNMEFRRKKFSIGQKLVETVALREDEILQIYKQDLSYNSNLENVRDAFILACYTGLRFSDFSTLKPEHIQEIEGETFIRKITQKTGEEVVIPLNNIILEILDKYKETPKRLPKVPCNIVFNKQLKVICQRAGLVEKGRLADQVDKELYQCISSHTGRRTFATNAYLAGVSILFIMRLTGHRTEKSFLRYVRFSRLEAAQKFSQQIRLNKSKQALTVAVNNTFINLKHAE